MRILIVILFLSVFIFASNHVEERVLNLSADSITELDIECGAGFLKVSAEPNMDEIKVTAEIVAEKSSAEKFEKTIKKYLELSLDKRGKRAFLISKFENVRSFFSGNANIQVNLTVQIPENINLKIDDGSGSIEIETAKGHIEIEDGSGSISIKHIEGNIDIDDGSGIIKVEDAKGDVVIDDGSGSIDISDIVGDVEISDGSGSISIDNVENDVIINNSGSGGVRISDVKGKIYRHDEDD